MEAYKKGFNKKQFEQDHFVFRRGTGEKSFSGWGDVQYYFGLTKYAVNENELECGNMGQEFYQALSHIYGEEKMAAYFPPSEPQQKRAVILHNSIGAAMAAMVDGKNNKAQPKGIMSDEEIDALAAIM